MLIFQRIAGFINKCKHFSLVWGKVLQESCIHFLRPFKFKVQTLAKKKNENKIFFSVMLAYSKETADVEPHLL